MSPTWHVAKACHAGGSSRNTPSSTTQEAVPAAAAAAVATGGGADDWTARDPACATQRAACSVRFGGAFSYTIRTVAGRSYRLRLTFAEVWWEAAGQRVFDVLVNGAVVLPGVDPYALVGAKFTPVVREVTLTATGANLVVSLQARADNAALAALEVSSRGGAACASTQQPGCLAQLCGCVVAAIPAPLVSPLTDG